MAAQVVRGDAGPGLRGPTFCVGLECGACVERCPFGVEVIDKMHKAVELFESTG